MRLVTDKPFYRPPSRGVVIAKPASFVIVNSVDYIDCLFLHSVTATTAIFSTFFFIGSFSIIAAGNKKKKKGKVRSA
jgi:hypothetical protein